MSNSESDRTLQQTFPSSLDSYAGFIQSVLDELTAMGWSQCDLFAVHMALEESISNAIRHGNKEDPVKQVEVECRLSPRRFWARVRDEGPGFELSKVPDCCAPERLELPGGRGLALIRAFMTSVEYSGCGNCVTLEKCLPNGEQVESERSD